MLVGLTGGIGSGKSTVALVLKAIGVPVFDADSEAKKLYKLPQVKQAVQNFFGEDIYSNGKLEKQKLAAIVFQAPEKLKYLESILYPALELEFKSWQECHSDAPYLVKEAAVLLEKGTYKDLDKIILVSADEELRIERVMKRNGVNRTEVVSRMKEQWPDEKKREHSDYEIVNDQQSSLVKKVWAVHEEIIKTLNSSVNINS